MVVLSTPVEEVPVGVRDVVRLVVAAGGIIVEAKGVVVVESSAVTLPPLKATAVQEFAPRLDCAFHVAPKSTENQIWWLGDTTAAWNRPEPLTLTLRMLP